MSHHGMQHFSKLPLTCHNASPFTAYVFNILNSDALHSERRLTWREKPADSA